MIQKYFFIKFISATIFLTTNLFIQWKILLKLNKVAANEISISIIANLYQSMVKWYIYIGQINQSIIPKNVAEGEL